MLAFQTLFTHLFSLTKLMKRTLVIVAAFVLLIGVLMAFAIATPAPVTIHVASPAAIPTPQIASVPTATTNMVRWYTWDEAVALNAVTKKKLFIDVYTSWCGWCKQMDRTTFEEPTVAAYLNKNFYPVKLDAEMRDSIIFDNHVFRYVRQGNTGYNELASSLIDNKMSFPTTVFLSENYNRVAICPGYMAAPEFTRILRYVGEEYYKKMPWEEFQKGSN